MYRQIHATPLETLDRHPCSDNQATAAAATQSASVGSFKMRPFLQPAPCQWQAQAAERMNRAWDWNGCDGPVREGERWRE